jgi:beta-glucosidase
LLTEVLRNQWGFKGYVVSDANDIARLNFFMNVAEDAEDAAVLGLTAGMDVDLYNDSCYALLPKLVKKKPELLQFIDRSALRMLRTKFILGLFENPYIDENESKSYIKNPLNVAIANDADAESFILLKNANNTLPLSKNGGLKIGLLGPVLPQNATKAFKEIAPSHTFNAQKGFDLTDKANAVPKLNPNALAGVDELLEIAKNQDLNILFIGDDEYTAKEAFFNNAYGDRADIDLVYPQDILFERIKQLNKPLIVVLKHRRTLSINNVAKNADAILDVWEPSEEYEKTLAMTFFGDINPSGKLPVTVPRTIGQFPFHYSSKEINNKKGYLFLEDGPLYPFGFGLSYTTFKYENINISNTELRPNTQIEVSVDVINRGAKVGKEVVQLYIKDIKGSVIRPDKELKAFQKIELQPGESKKVTFKIDPEILKFTTINMKKEFEPGDYKIFVGPNSKEGLVTNFKLKL